MTDYYEGARRIQAAPTLPTPDRVGPWWRRRVRYAVARPASGDVPLPPPPEPRHDAGMVWTGRWVSPLEFEFEALWLNPAGREESFKQAWVVARWLQLITGDDDVAIDGVHGHPGLRWVRFNDEYLTMLRDGGYLG